MDSDKYKEMIYDCKIRPHDIMEKIKIPDSVFKYRKFVDLIDKKADTYWKESLNGEIYFSKPSLFNSNDSEDCIFEYDKEKCEIKLKELFLKYSTSERELKKIWNCVEKHIDENVRDNIKIGCFTECAPENEFMWKCKEFGAEHTGYCIEYKVDKENFYPSATNFLKVLYLEEHIDMTDVVVQLIEATCNQTELDKHNIIMANGYNFALCKTLQYEKENEWRVIVTKNNWTSYFNLDNKNKRDFSKKMKAIYLGEKCERLENYKIYKDFAMETCKQKICRYIK